MTYWQMYEQSKRLCFQIYSPVLPRAYLSCTLASSFRYWEKLPEVKEKERVEKKKAQIRTNMLRVKIYQRVSHFSLQEQCIRIFDLVNSLLANLN